MNRVSSGPASHRRHRKVIRQCKGFVGRAKNCFRIGIQRLEKAWQYAYRDRRTKKRDLKSVWIQRINAAARVHGLRYSEFIYGLQLANIISYEMNEKIIPYVNSDTPKSIRRIVKTRVDQDTDRVIYFVEVKSRVGPDAKILADMAVRDAEAFLALIKKAKEKFDIRRSEVKDIEKKENDIRTNERLEIEKMRKKRIEQKKKNREERMQRMIHGE